MSSGGQEEAARTAGSLPWEAEAPISWVSGMMPKTPSLPSSPNLPPAMNDLHPSFHLPGLLLHSALYTSPLGGAAVCA